ncbi:MAG: methyltransferase [Staphylothermus sp.]|nr:methyltransferase [Staphylothermus sp.]
MSPIICVKVEKRSGETAIRILKNHNMINPEYRVYSDKEYVYIPINEKTNKEELKSILDKHKINFQIVLCNPPEKEKRIQLKHVPSYDLLGDTIIVRKNVLENISLYELIYTLRKLNPRIKAIYMKHETIDSYRLPKLELVWGEPVEEVIVKEYGLRFKILLGKVYYNKRLSEEHRRIAYLCKDGEVVMDLFSGIGGFAIHIASLRKSIVFANDLNPYAYQCILDNISLNKKFLKGIIIPMKINALFFTELKPLHGLFDRLIANLPHSSLEFKRVYDVLLKNKGILHLYVVSKNPDEVVRILRKWDNYVLMGYRRVLDYAPYTFIYRFDLLKK